MSLQDDIETVHIAVRDADFSWTEGPAHEALFREVALEALARLIAALPKKQPSKTFWCGANTPDMCGTQCSRCACEHPPNHRE